MKTRLILLCGLAVSCAASRGQDPLTTALTNQVDPRSVAMGEGFVAVRGNGAALMYNPAGLAGSSETGIAYAYREVNWTGTLGKFDYHSVVATIPTPFATFGIMYSRNDEGEFIETASNQQTPLGFEDVGTAAIHNDVFAIGASHSFDFGLDVGICAKTFGYGVSAHPPGSFRLFDGITRPYLFDVGVLYGCGGPLSGERISDMLTIGASAQNFGTDMKFPDGTSERAPRYLRVGFSYAVSLLGPAPESLRPLAILLTGEYRNHANADSDYNDYWGIGVESTWLETLSLRVGGIASPMTYIYGKRGSLAIRYGLGLNIPLNRLGISDRLVVRGEYTAIPLRLDPMFSGFFLNTRAQLDVWGASIGYRL